MQAEKASARLRSAGDAGDAPESFGTTEAELPKKV